MRPRPCWILALLAALAVVPGVICTAEDTTAAASKTTSLGESDLGEKQQLDTKVLNGNEDKDGAGGVATLELGASEVGDMMLDPYRPAEVDSDDEKEKPVDSDTVVVSDSHVVNGNRTHESDVSSTRGKNDSVPGSVPVVYPTDVTATPLESLPPPGSTLTSNATEVPAEVSTPDNVTETYSPAISTGLSSVSIASISRSVMSTPSEVAALMSIVLSVCAIAGYVGMLAWRTYLERRYGNREMLVNEDDDLRNFEL